MYIILKVPWDLAYVWQFWIGMDTHRSADINFARRFSYLTMVERVHDTTTLSEQGGALELSLNDEVMLQNKLLK